MDGQTSIELREPGLVTYHDVEFAPDGRSIYYVMENDDRTSCTGYRPVGTGEGAKMSPGFLASRITSASLFSDTDGGKNTSVVISNVDGANERTVLTAPILET